MAAINIRARCHCGDVKLRPSDIRLSIDPQGRRSFYIFRCPECRTLIQRPALASLVDKLLSAGVIADEQILRRLDLPPVTWDELIDFHAEAEEWDGVMR